MFLFGFFHSLPNGNVLAAGGATTEVYDPVTHSWSTAASMASARTAHTATLLSSGRLLVAGGANGSALSSAELYTP